MSRFSVLKRKKASTAGSVKVTSDRKVQKLFGLVKKYVAGRACLLFLIVVGMSLSLVFISLILGFYRNFRKYL